MLSLFSISFIGDGLCDPLASRQCLVPARRQFPLIVIYY